jgi:hypothetical protein
MAIWVQNTSQGVNDVSNYPTIIAVCICMTTFMMCVVGLRVYVRASMLKLFGLDDWIVVFSAVSLSIMALLNQFGGHCLY